jgi:tRNA-splicing ligase RtcB
MKQFKIYGKNIEESAINQFFKAMKQDFVAKGALMPDAHQGYTLPIGAVIATKDIIVPSYVGYDLGCGVCAYKTKFHKSDIEKFKKEIFNQVYKDLPVGFNKHSIKKQIPDSLYNDIKEVCTMINGKFDNALQKMATLGGGNHFAEIGYDTENYIWIIIHSGSRHFGHQIGTYFMKEAAIKSIDEDRYSIEFDEKNNHWKDKNPEGYEKSKKEFIYRRTRARLKTKIEGHFGLNVNSKEGKDYIYCLNVALEYALLNRKLMIEIIHNSICKVLKTKESINFSENTFINRNHNHAELKDGLWIHRKGATHAEKGMYGVIPGNMRDGSFIVRGKGNSDSLCSSSHGAGRIFSRKKAKEKFTVKDFSDTMKDVEAKVTKSTLDESPMAYKNIFDVMDLQSDLVDIITRIKPIINIKG